ncbi:hypothetical protein ACC685_33465 [Rhizobium ruizarguesonis]
MTNMLRYYDKTDFQIRREAAAAAHIQANFGLTARMSGDSLEDRVKQVQDQKKEAFKIYYQKDDVQTETQKFMTGIGDKAFRTLDSAFNSAGPAVAQRVGFKRPKDAKSEAIEGMPHLGYTVIGNMDVRKRDGSVSRLVVFASNFEATVIPDQQGGQQFKGIKPQVDGVENKSMLYAYARHVGPDGKPGAVDQTFSNKGVAFRMNDLRHVAETMCQVAGIPKKNERTATADKSNRLVARPVPERRQIDASAGHGMRLG